MEYIEKTLSLKSKFEVTSIIPLTRTCLCKEGVEFNNSLIEGDLSHVKDVFVELDELIESNRSIYILFDGLFSRRMVKSDIRSFTSNWFKKNNTNEVQCMVFVLPNIMTKLRVLGALSKSRLPYKFYYHHHQAMDWLERNKNIIRFPKQLTCLKL